MNRFDRALATVTKALTAATELGPQGVVAGRSFGEPVEALETFRLAIAEVWTERSGNAELVGFCDTTSVARMLQPHHPGIGFALPA